MTRDRTVLRAVFAIVGSFLLLIGGVWIAIWGLAFSMNTELWRGDVKGNLIYFFIALAMIVGAVLLFRNSLRRLRPPRRGKA